MWDNTIWQSSKQSLLGSDEQGTKLPLWQDEANLERSDECFKYEYENEPTLRYNKPPLHLWFYLHCKRQQKTLHSQRIQIKLMWAGGMHTNTLQEETWLNRVDPPHQPIHTSMQTVVEESWVMGKKEGGGETRKTIANHCYLTVIWFSNAQTHVKPQ